MMHTRRPSPPLSSTVECIWDHEGLDLGAHGRERVLPDGRFQVVLDLVTGLSAVSGLRAHHVVIDTAKISCVMGVVFHPAGARRFFTPPALEFYDRSVPLEVVWGPNATELVERLREAGSASERLATLEAALIEIDMKGNACRVAAPPGVRYALRTFLRSPHVRSIADVSREVGWSRRWLCQGFGEAVGMTPKQFCRLMRFQQVVREIASGRPIDWANVAFSCGFADQAHLVHEFKAFSGLTPARYLAAARPFPNHVRMD